MLAPKAQEHKFWPEKVFSTNNPPPPHLSSQTDQRDVGIILSHRCWVDPPPRHSRSGTPALNPPSRHGGQGGGRGGWENGLPCHPPPPPPRRAIFFPPNSWWSSFISAGGGGPLPPGLPSGLPPPLKQRPGGWGVGGRPHAHCENAWQALGPEPSVRGCVGHGERLRPGGMTRPRRNDLCGYFIDPGCSLESAERTSTQVTRRANRKKRLTVLYIVEHPNQEGDTCIDWTSQYCWTNGWNCLWRGHSVYRHRPLIPPPPSWVVIVYF